MILNKIIIGALLCYQCAMITNFHDFTGIEDDYLICIFNRAESVSHNNNCSTFVELIEVFYNGTLILCI